MGGDGRIAPQTFTNRWQAPARVLATADRVIFFRFLTLFLPPLPSPHGRFRLDTPVALTRASVPPPILGILATIVAALESITVPAAERVVALAIDKVTVVAALR